MSPDLAAHAESLLDRLCAEWPLGYRPALAWRPYRVSAGRAYLWTGRIGLSSRLLTDETRVRDTLVHEYAHLLAVHRHGPAGANHGPPWKQAMRDLGAEPVRTHDYPVAPPRSGRTVRYRCARCGLVWERRRRLPRRGVWLHHGCGGLLDEVTEPGPA